MERERMPDPEPETGGTEPPELTVRPEVLDALRVLNEAAARGELTFLDPMMGMPTGRGRAPMTEGGMEPGMGLDLPRPEEDPQDQINKLSKIMSDWEFAKGFSYQALASAYDPEFMRLRQTLRHLSYEARNFFDARIQIFEISKVVPEAGNTMDAFMQLGNAIRMPWADIMLSQPDVAKAFFELDRRANDKRFANDDEWKRIKKENPVFASVEDLDKLRVKMALGLAGWSEEEIVARTNDYDRYSTIRGTELSPEDRAAKSRYEDALKNHIWAVRQAETIWRAWGRAASMDSLVFKPGVSEDEVRRLMTLRPDELSANWESVVQAVDWDKSFSGNGEFAPRRLFGGAYVTEKTKLGVPRIRPYLDWQGKDMVSIFLSEKYITSADNFKDGRAFELVIPPGMTKEDLADKNKEFVKKDAAGNVVERAYVSRTGFTTFGEGFNPMLIKWTSQGDSYYQNNYSFKNLVQAEGVRKEVMDVGKFARNPNISNLEALQPALERFTSLAEDYEAAIVKGKTPDEALKELDDKRREGKVYRQDVVGRLALGMIEFLRKDRYATFRRRNIDLEELYDIVQQLRINGLLTNEQEKDVREMASHTPDEFLWIYKQYKVINPPGAFFAMIAEFFKQAIPLK